MLEVRSVGAIPVRERRGDPVSRFSTVIPPYILQKNTGIYFLLRSHGDQWCQQSIPHPLLRLPNRRKPSFRPNTSNTRSTTATRPHPWPPGSSSSTNIPTKQQLLVKNNKNVFPFSIPGQQGLGCSVCRGPPSKPGVFVQSTKPGGLAREAGLRPGDQVGK